jgi:hypothetical protein
MMKSKFLLLMFALVFAVAPLSLMAQDEGDEDDLDDMDLSVAATEQDSGAEYFTIGAGFVGQFLFTNLDDMNADLAKTFTNGELQAPIFMTGVHGFTAIGVVPNLRIGIFGLSGSTEVSQEVTLANDLKANQGFEYSISITGFSFDYAIVPMRKLAILPGANIAFGTIKMESWQTPNDDVNWDDLVGPDIENTYFNRAEATVLFFEPNVKVEYALAPFVMLRLQGGYSVNVTRGDWEYNRTGKFADSESSFSNAKADGFTFQFGINVGLFNY